MDTRLAQLSLSDFVKERLNALLTRSAKEWERCSVSADADAIHDFRVSLRRFSEALRLFKGLFPKAARNQVRSELRQAMRLAGRTRNVDIARETFVLSDAVITPGTCLFLDNERATAEAAFRAVLSVGLVTRVSQRWEETLGLSAGAGEAASIPGAAVTATWNPAAPAATNARLHLPPLLSFYCQCGEKLAHEAVKPARLHPLRLTGKHLRYAIEIFRPIYGRTIDGLLETLRETQSSLGEVSDATATLEWLKRRNLQQIPEAVHLRHYLERRAGKGTSRFVTYWHDHWGFPAFRDRWISYLGRYAGQMPPVPRIQLQEPGLPCADGQQDLEPSPSPAMEIVA
jgi:CHAD domain-containing protein